MLYAILTRTWLWLYWFVEYHSFEEDECGCGNKVDCEDLLDWLDDFLKINAYNYGYWKYENI